MPSKYPVYSAKEVTQKLENLGFVLASQKGSHRKYKKNGRVVIVPMHSEIAKGTLKSILSQASICRQLLGNKLPSLQLSCSSPKAPTFYRCNFRDVASKAS